MAEDALKIWFDFTCPWARIATHWIRNLQDLGVLGDVDWRAFSLEHVNLAPERSPDELWAEPAATRGLLPHGVAKWVEGNRQDLYEAVQRAFFDARHLERRKIGQPQVTAEIVGSLGLDGERVVDVVLDDPRCLRAARTDHEEAASVGIFGVPTFQFPAALPVFLRLREITEGADAVALLGRVRLAAYDSTIMEMKRPVK